MASRTGQSDSDDEPPTLVEAAAVELGGLSVTEPLPSPSSQIKVPITIVTGKLRS
jgi:hypothetical protein